MRGGRRGLTSILSAATLLVAAACSAQPAPTEEPSASPQTSPSGLPPATAVPSDGHSRPSTLLVVADEVRLRDAAGTDADIVGALSWGTVAEALEGPTEADGFAWYRLQARDGSTGWAAAGDATDDWLLPVLVPTGAERRVELSTLCDVIGPYPPPDTTILEDGLVVTTTTTGGLVAGILSPEGMRSLQDEVLANPYLQQDAQFLPVPRPGAGEAPGHGSCEYTFVIGGGDDPVTVSSMMWFGDAEERQFYEPSPERKALTDLAQSLSEIEVVLPHDAWAVGPLRYVADDYLLWMMPEAGPMQGRAVDFSTLGLGATPDDFGAIDPAGLRCGTISSDQAAAVSRALRAAGIEPGLDRFIGGAMRADGQGFSFELLPQSPLGRPACEGSR